MAGIKITYLDPDDLMIISDGNQSEGKAATYLDLEAPLPYPNQTTYQRKLQRAINSLPDQQCKIIKLFLRGISNKQIAIRLRISQGQVATQKSNAIRKLKKIKG